MNPAWIAALTAVFAWWFATGAILAVVKRADAGGRRSHIWAVLLALPLLVLGAGLYVDTLVRTEVGAVYAAFFAALMIWGWIEMAFLCGVITGPNRLATPAGTPEWERFVRAWGAVAHHEMLLLLALIVMGWAALVVSAGVDGGGQDGTAEAINPFGFWTFALLFGARISAKLNLFYGVPRINTDFLPEALAHLPTHFRVRRINWVFPVSVLGLALTCLYLFEHLAAQTAPHAIAGFALLSAIAALALIEHLLMVIPLPDAKLWRWMLPEPHPPRPDPPAD
ncbi:MAG: putative photosynthetic complex assembly protein PuhE [Pseudomonadota bacterium]